MTIHHTYTQMKGKEQLEVRKDIDVNEHDRLSITLEYTIECKGTA